MLLLEQRPSWMSLCKPSKVDGVCPLRRNPVLLRLEEGSHSAAPVLLVLPLAGVFPLLVLPLPARVAQEGSNLAASEELLLLHSALAECLAPVLLLILPAWGVAGSHLAAAPVLLVHLPPVVLLHCFQEQ